MHIQHVIISSAGTLAVGFVAFFYALIQFWFHFSQKDEPWHAWGGLICLATAMYAVSVFLQYFLGRVPINHFCELIQYTSIILLLHCVYGFTFSYLNINARPYHLFAGLLHASLIAVLWTTHTIVSPAFVSRNFLFLTRAYVEPAIGPLGIFFFMYICCAVIIVPYIWIRHKTNAYGASSIFLSGFSIWLILALHDVLITVLKIKSVQFLMEYGFLAFSLSLILVGKKKSVYLADLVKSQAKKLEKKSGQYRLLVENANDAICIAQDGRLCFANPRTEEITGYSLKELMTIPFKNIIHPEDRQFVLSNHKKRLTGEKFQPVYNFRIVNKSGRIVWVQINAVRIEWKGRPATLNFLRDISEQTRLESELRDSDRLKAITILSGGIAHEFNNALTIVIGNAELLEHLLPDSHPGREYLMPIMTASQRMADLCKKLVAFARCGNYAPERLSINPVIESVVSALREVAGTRIEFSLDLGPDLNPVMADYEQIEMVIHAIITNAVEGIRQTGTITIKTENIFCSGQNFSDKKEKKHGPLVCITISDTGVGMDKKTISMVFDPFFTTKFQGRGMSMAAVYGIVKAHNGWIDIDSQPEKGSVVKVFLPAQTASEQQR